MSTPQSPRERDMLRQGHTESVPMPRAMGSAAHAATAIPELPQAAATLAQAVDDSTPSAVHLRPLLDTLPILASCHLPDGSTAFCNQRWHDYTGLAPEDARSWGWHVTLHPDDLGRVRDMWRTCLAAGEQGEVEGRLRRCDGAYRWFLFRAAPWRDAVGNIVTWYSTATDINDLKRAAARLQHDERELRRITDAIPHTIVTQTPDGTPLYANQAVLDYTGLTMEDVLTSDFRARIFHPEDLERLRDERQAALARGLPFEIEGSVLKVEMDYEWCHTGPRLDSVQQRGVVHDVHRGPMSPLSQRADCQTWQNTSWNATLPVPE